jgi:hypothetical protein
MLPALRRRRFELPWPIISTIINRFCCCCLMIIACLALICSIDRAHHDPIADPLRDRIIAADPIPMIHRHVNPIIAIHPTPPPPPPPDPKAINDRFHRHQRHHHHRDHHRRRDHHHHHRDHQQHRHRRWDLAPSIRFRDQRRIDSASRPWSSSCESMAAARRRLLGSMDHGVSIRSTPISKKKKKRRKIGMSSMMMMMMIGRLLHEVPSGPNPISNAMESAAHDR